MPNYADFASLSLPDSPLNVAIRALMAQLTLAEDEEGNRLFRSVRAGLAIPQGSPQRTEVPMCRVWRDRSERIAENEQFVVTDIFQDVDLLLYFYDFNEDGTCEEQIENFVRTILAKLQEPTSGATGQDGLMPGAIRSDTQWDDGGCQTWNFPAQVVEVVQTQALRKVTGYDQILPPWYVVRIGVRVYSQNKDIE